MKTPLEHSLCAHTTLTTPTALRLLNLRPPESVLELSCSTGHLSLAMGKLGAKVLATDSSRALLDLAEERAGEVVASFHTLDVTSIPQLEVLAGTVEKAAGFDAVVANMALTGFETLEPLAAVLPRLLRPGGRFVATVMHPSFNSPGAHRTLQVRDGSTVRSVCVGRYMDIPPQVVEGQQDYFHRPLEELLRPFLAAGLVLDGLEEPVFTGEDVGEGEVSWMRFTQIPPVLGFRMRRGGGRYNGE